MYFVSGRMLSQLVIFMAPQLMCQTVSMIELSFVECNTFPKYLIMPKFELKYYYTFI